MNTSLRTLTTTSVIAILAIAGNAFALNIGAGARLEVSTHASTSVGVDAKISARIEKGQEHANQEIDRRVNALKALNERVQEMTRLTADQKTSIDASVVSQISTLAALKVKIDGDTDFETLKADIKSITQSYRIFLLVIPQGRITVAVDRIKSIIPDMTAFSAKLSTRIEAAAAGGNDVSAMQKSLSDLNAKSADAGVQADVALALVVNLKPDNGDKAIATANEKALKDGREKVKASMKAIQTAREDARAIVKALVALNLGASASTTTTTP